MTASHPDAFPKPHNAAWPGVVGKEGQHLVLSPIGWDQYTAVADALGERAGLRMTYFGGRLTLLSPTRGHDWIAERLGQIVVAAAQGLDILWEDSGHATYRNKGKGAGVEGDKTYYFGGNAVLMRGSQEIDLATQPPPDLAIEVEVTHSADDAAEAWGRIGVPELWRMDVRRQVLVFGRRLEDGSYSPASHSLAFPVLEPADVLAQLRLAEELGSSPWLRQLDAWVRDVLVPRLGG